MPEIRAKLVRLKISDICEKLNKGIYLFPY